MIGGRFKVASVASVAAAGLFMGGVSAQAADLGGNCCADLEERVAELEATTVRKGNRKVSLEVSGHVNEAILLWDDGVDDGAYIVTNGFSQTRFRFKGAANINADWSAGFLIELGLQRPGNSGTANQFRRDAILPLAAGDDRGFRGVDGLNIRHQALYVKSRTLGTVWMGHTSTAVDGVADICLGCTTGSSFEQGLGWQGFRVRNTAGEFGPSQHALGAGDNIYNPSRRQMIKYISPTLAGFVLSADWGGQNNADSGYADQWSVALRYAAEFNSVRIAGGVGYHEENFKEGWGGSLSFQHTPTGLFIAGSMAQQDNNLVNELGVVGGEDRAESWSVAGGWGQKWSSLGRTTIWARYAEYKGTAAAVITDFGPANGIVGAGVVTDWINGESDVISFGINQKIDAAAMELYANYYNVSTGGNVAATGENVRMKDLNAIMLGARIKF